MTKDQPPVIAQTNVVTPVCHALVTNADSTKSAPSNGLIAPCTILPQVHKQQRILMSCANLSNPPVPMNVCHPQNALLHHHVVNATLIPHTTQVMAVALPSAVAFGVAPTVVHAVMIVMMMIALASVSLVPVMMAMLDIMASLPTLLLKTPFGTADASYIVMLMVFISDRDLICQTTPQISPTWTVSVHHLDLLTPPSILEVLITLPGILTQRTIQTTPFILTVMVTEKTLSPRLIVLQLTQIMMIMTMIVICILVSNPSNVTISYFHRYFWYPKLHGTRVQRLQLLVPQQTGWTTPCWVDWPQCYQLLLSGNYIPWQQKKE